MDGRARAVREGRKGHGAGLRASASRCVASRHVTSRGKGKRPRARVEEEEEEGGGHVTVAGAAAAAL